MLTSGVVRGRPRALDALITVMALPWLGGCGTSSSRDTVDAAPDVASAVDSAAADGATDVGDGPSIPRAPDGGGLPVEASSDATSDAPESSAPGDAGDAGGAACILAVDCRTFSNYCGGCACDALGVHAPDPVCDGGTVSCFTNPCAGHTAACGPAGRCILQ